MNQNIKKWAGFAGLCLLLVAAVLYTVRGRADLAFWIPLGLGAASLAWYLASYRREALQILVSRKTRYGANSVFLSLLVLAAVAFLQAILSNHDLSWDLSKGKVHTLSDEAVKAAKNLDAEIQAYAFFQTGEARVAPFEDLLKRVKSVNPGKFKYEFVDMNKKPLLATQYAVRGSGTTVLVAPGGRTETLNGVKEEDLVNALLKISSTGSKTVYVLMGHGEKSTQDLQPSGLSELKRGLENSNFSVKDLGLISEQKVPDDCAVLLLPGPQTDYLGPELALLDAYLARGGRLVVAVDPRVRLQGLIAWLKRSGVQVNDDVVVDYNPLNQLFGGSPIAPIVNSLDRNHPVTKDMASARAQIIAPISRSVSLASPLPTQAEGTALANTFNTAWGYRGTANQIPAKPGPADLKGPLGVAVAVEAPAADFQRGAKAAPAPEAPRARLVVLGSSSILGNQGVAMFNNQDFAVNAVRWLADEEKRIAIAPKEEETTALQMDEQSIRLIRWSLVLLCLGSLALGGVVIRRRRRAA